MSNLPWPQPGQCWRIPNKKEWDSIDRARLGDDGLVRFVDISGRAVTNATTTLVFVINKERAGEYIRCPDEPQKPAPVDFGEPWSVQLGDFVRNRDDKCVLLENTEKHRNRCVACVNALQGIRNPAAVKGLIEETRKCVAEFAGYGSAAACRWFKHLEAIDKPEGTK